VGLKSRLFKHYFPEVLAAGAFYRMPPSSGIVLMYHEVLPDDISLPAWTIVRESNFRCQMSYLRAHFDVVSIDHALERVGGKHNAKRPFAVVTFDDGYQGNFSTVLPIMEAMGLPFTVYVATKAIVEKELYWYDRIINLLNVQEDVQLKLIWNDHSAYFSIPQRGENRRWREVQKLLNRLKLMALEEREKNVRNIAGKFSGIESPLKMLSEVELQRLADSSNVTIGCHTHTHELLDQLEPIDVRETLHIANKHITELTGCPPRHFAYPNGNFNDCVLNLVREAKYASAVTTLPGIWSHKDNRLIIPRIGIGRFDSMGLFKARVSGYL